MERIRVGYLAEADGSEAIQIVCLPGGLGVRYLPMNAQQAVAFSRRSGGGNRDEVFADNFQFQMLILIQFT